MTPAILAAAGLVAGLALFVRGLLSYLRAQRIGGIPTSQSDSIAVGEVRVSGTVRPDAMLLVSPLQSERCVWYRARVVESSGRSSTTILDESRAIGFRVEDPGGSIRVFPRGATFSAPDRLDDAHGSMFGEAAPGVRLNRGPTLVGVVDDDREAQVRELLTVHPATPATGSPADRLSARPSAMLDATDAGRRYTEARISPGDVVTVIGWAVPFGSLDDPVGADESAVADAVIPPDDPALLADLAAARAAGTLADTPEEAWGNAAIPGFGIGQPVRPPELDPEVPQAQTAGAAELAARAALAERVERRFEIPGDELVLAVGDEMPLTVYEGAPVAAAGREQDRFLVGLLGAALAIACAVALAYLLRGGTLA